MAPGAGGRSNKPPLRAPAAVDQRFMSAPPKFRQLKDGSIEITNEESVLAVGSSDTGLAMQGSIAVRPQSFGWLSGIAEHFQNYQFTSVKAEYRPLAPTSTPGAVVVAPFYQPDDPTRGNNKTGSLSWMKALPGAKQFSVWAPGAVGMAAEQLTRMVFNIVGLTSNGASQASAPESKYSTTPGYILYGLEGINDTFEKGNIWVKYTVRLHAPKQSHGSSNLQIYSQSTDSSALALQSAVAIGARGLYELSGNRIKFLRPGSYAVWMHTSGTSTVQDLDGHTMEDNNGRTVSRWTPGYVPSTGSVVASADSQSSGSHAVVGTNDYGTLTYVEAAYGDSLIIDALTSGTLSSTMICIFESGDLFMSA